MPDFPLRLERFHIVPEPAVHHTLKILLIVDAMDKAHIGIAGIQQLQLPVKLLFDVI